jgi:hypothetical protein
MSPSLQGNRSIRVFLSSTLRDMKEEREALMSHTWPALRQFCREREAEFVEVDLRWGISEEQSNRNETLQLGVGMTQLPLVGSWLSDNGDHLVREAGIDGCDAADSIRRDSPDAHWPAVQSM